MGEVILGILMQCDSNIDRIRYICHSDHGQLILILPCIFMTIRRMNIILGIIIGLRDI